MLTVSTEFLSATPSQQRVVEEECSICLDAVFEGSQFVTPCNHTFHAKCITDWQKRDDSCPMCRAPIQAKVLTKEENPCTICLEDLGVGEIFTTPCNHKFHATCINQWKDTGKDSCPNCRQSMKVSDPEAERIGTAVVAGFAAYFFSSILTSLVSTSLEMQATCIAVGIIAGCMLNDTLKQKENQAAPSRAS